MCSYQITIHNSPIQHWAYIIKELKYFALLRYFFQFSNKIIYIFSNIYRCETFQDPASKVQSLLFIRMAAMFHFMMTREQTVCYQDVVTSKSKPFILSFIKADTVILQSVI
jgi:hypothetical protein